MGGGFHFLSTYWVPHSGLVTSGMLWDILENSKENPKEKQILENQILENPKEKQF